MMEFVSKLGGYNVSLNPGWLIAVGLVSVVALWSVYILEVNNPMLQ